MSTYKGWRSLVLIRDAERNNTMTTTHEPDLVNEDILADQIADFDGFLKKHDWENAQAIVENLYDMKQGRYAVELHKMLVAAKMRVPEITHFREEDNPLNGVEVEGFEEEIY